MTHDPVLTPQEIADELGRSPKTIRAWLQAGLLKGSKHGRDWFVRRSWLEEFLQPTNVA